MPSKSYRCFALLMFLTTGIVVALGATLVWVIPPGEAPDEPAHLAYIAYLAEFGALPPIPASPSPSTYEFYQPPMPYVVAALFLHFGGVQPAVPFLVPDPDFEFAPRQLAFVHTTPLHNSESAFVHACRTINLGWLSLTVLSIMVLCARIAQSPVRGAICSLPFVLCPQLLFTCASANNDAAVIALSSIATMGLVCVLDTARPSLSVVTCTSIVAGLALWAKLSAIGLAPALLAAAFLKLGRRDFRFSLALLGPYVTVALSSFAFEYWRSGSVVPMFPTGMSSGSGQVIRLLLEPRWMISAWLSFWAKFGWFNALLPWPYYAWFVFPTMTAFCGFLIVLRRWRAHPASSACLLVATSNLFLLMAYMTRVDWQPQGRYMLPALAALAGLATRGALSGQCSGLIRRHAITLATVCVACSGLSAGAAVWWLYSVYRS